MHRAIISFFSGLALTGAISFAAACGSASGGPGGGTGGHATGSRGSGSGGNGSGGSGSGGNGSGGNGSGGNGSGGNGSGGTSATGGITATGGATATGGKSAATGGTTGTATGGVTATGGSTGSGGTGTGGTGGMSTSGTGGASAGGRTGAGAVGGATGSAGQAGSTGAGCAGKSYKLCEDFEAGMAGAMANGWTTLAGFGSGAMQGVSITSVTAHSGAQAVQSNSSMTGQARLQKSLSGLGATASKHWGRIFYKVGMPPVKPSSGVLHITMLSLEGGTEDRVVDTVEDMNGKRQWLFNIPDDSCCTSSTYDWSFDNDWHCAEWYVDAGSQSYRFFTDGTEVTSIGFMNRSGAKMSTWTSVAVGAIFYQSVPSAVTMWFDDLAIDDSQIGCQ